MGTTVIEPLPTTWWCSFCDPGRPPGSQFLGACIVGGVTFPVAIQRSWTLGINPGGEISAREFPVSVAAIIDARWRDRLLTKAECAEFDDEMQAKLAS